MPSAHAHIPPLSELVADAKHSRGLQGRWRGSRSSRTTCSLWRRCPRMVLSQH